MRRFLPFLMTFLLLWGCAAQPEETSAPTQEATIPIPAETQPAAVPVTTEELPDPLLTLLGVLTPEEKVGQLFLARCPASGSVEDIEKYHLGGYILFGQDFKNQTPDSLRQTLAGYQAASPVPLLIAVDEEGGTVCRVSSNPSFRASRFPSPREAYAQGGMEQALAVEAEKAALLKEVGIHVNMAPVCDIATDSGAFMYQRSLGQDATETGRFAAYTVQIMAQHHVGSVLKHFPGYGNNADTHTGIVRDSRSLSELESQDLLPFAAGMDAGCDAVLVSHTILDALDDTLPASLSPAVHDYLRSSMGFDGVIVTDDLVMQAITDAYGAEEAAVLAVLAGNDLLCSTEYAIQYEAVLDAVNTGRISTEQLDEAVLRILRWKKELGMIF